MKKYLLIISSYTSDEVHFYDSINELLKNWGCTTLRGFFRKFNRYNVKIIFVEDIITKDNFDNFLY